MQEAQYEKIHREALKFSCKQLGDLSKEIFEDYIFQGKLDPALALELYNEVGARIGYKKAKKLVPTEIPLFYKSWLPRSVRKGNKEKLST